MHKRNKVILLTYFHISSGWTGTVENTNTPRKLLIKLEYNYGTWVKHVFFERLYISQLIMKAFVLEGFSITRRHYLQCLTGKTHTNTHKCLSEKNIFQHATRLNSVPLLATTDNWRHKMLSEIRSRLKWRITTNWRNCVTTGFPKS